VHRDDRGVLEATLDLRFAQEALHLAIGWLVGADALDRDLAADLLVTRGKHLAHATATDPIAEPIPIAGDPRLRRSRIA